MNNIPNNFVIDFTQVLDVWVTLKAIVILTTCLYASFGKGDGLNRLFKVVVFGVCVFWLAGCSGPNDSMIAQSKTMQLQTEANAAQSQQQSNALQNSTNQATTANSIAQTAMSNAQLGQAQASQAQAEEGIAQANANANLGIAQTNANANIVANALIALDSAAERQAQQLRFYNGMMAVGLIAIVILVILYFRWKLWTIEHVRDNAPKTPVRLLQNQPLTDHELLHMALAAGYLVESVGNGYSEIRHPTTGEKVSRQQLLSVKE